MTDIPDRFPKVESPYHRAENDDGDYVIEGHAGGPSDYTKSKFAWVFDRAEEVEAIEKLDGCFTYKSRVETKENGSVPIGKIVQNELDVHVLSYNFDTGQAEYRPVAEYHQYDQNTSLVTVRVSHNTHGGNSRTFVATEDHEVWTDDGWVEAGNLTESHTVYRAGTSAGPETEQILLGTLLGDGHVETIQNPTVRYTHSVNQLSYSTWKENNIELETTTRTVGPSGYDGSTERLEVRVETDPQSSSIASKFIDADGNKSVPDNIADLIQPLGLAVWYMDDGTLNTGSNGQRPRSSIATNGFAESEVETLVSLLRDEFGIECRVAMYADGPVIECTADGTEKLHTYIWPYVIDEMEYKLLDRYHGTGSCMGSFGEFADDTESLIESSVSSVEQGTAEWRNTSSVYDLTVESNHNYFVGGVLVHNTNMAVHVAEHEHGGLHVDEVATRMGDKSMNRVEPFGPRTNHHYITRAVQNSVRRGYIEQVSDEYGEGWFFGEAVGPKFQGNPHRLDEHLFVPFDWIRKKLAYKSYGEYPTDFESIRDWVRGEENGLFSLFASRMHGQDLDASRPQNGTFCEGLVFVHPDFEGRITPDDLTVGNDGQSVKELAKLRRDMYDGFQRDEWPMTEWGH